MVGRQKGFLVFIFLIGSLVVAERPPTGKTRLLKPKRTITNLTENRNPDSYPSHQLSFFLLTPALRDNLYDKAFTTVGFQALYSFVFTDFDNEFYLMGETGFSGTFSKLSIPQPAVTFSHMYFDFPLRIRGVFRMAPDFFGELLGGIFFRVWENDSRPTEDGGFRRVTDLSLIQFDGGFGASYHFTSAIHLRGTVTFNFATLGISIGL